ncbi:MAG: SRPBCC domain-containing protein [Bacteroidia bacterium]|jgi:uncharacterized protein YndB with AHSA1/START domain|nr:SRPBCC domain-containing protein [Bacteroidia bacterium]
MSFIKINIQAEVNASKQKAWEVYTSPEHIIKWNFASEDWCCPKATNDLTVGGKYFARMEAKDGSWGFDFEAIYNEITLENTFTYTMPDNRKIEVLFEEIDSQNTLVSIAFDAENENPIDMQEMGWQSILNQYKTYLESLG